ncbi:MAG: hypothetical protein ABW163_07490, partial [Luteimonas sp.]
METPGNADATDAGAAVLCLSDIGFEAPAALLAGYGLTLHRVPDDAEIPGSYWGAPEAGIIGCDVYA